MFGRRKYNVTCFFPDKEMEEKWLQEEKKYNIPLDTLRNKRNFNFKEGKTIESINELVDICIKKKQSIWFHNFIVNWCWVSNQQLLYLLKNIEAGHFKVALKKEKNEKGRGKRK